MLRQLLFVFLPLTLVYSSIAKVKMMDIVFDQRFHDFGTIYEENGVVLAKYSFTNFSSEAFIIIGIDAACGCTNPRSSKDTFLSGESGEILAEFNPKGIIGKTKKWIYVRGNFEDGYQIELRFEANIRSTYKREHYEYMRGEFGYLLIDQMKLIWGDRYEDAVFTDSVELTNDGYNTITVSQASFDHDFIKVQNLPVKIPVGEQRKLLFNIDLSQTDTIGLVSGYIRFMTDDKFYPQKLIPYSVNFKTDFKRWRKKELKKAAHIAFSSTTLQMGNMQSGAVRSQKITIQNTGKSVLNIRRIDTDCSCTLLNLPSNNIQPGDSIEAVIKYDSLFKKGKQSKLIKLYSNDPVLPVATLFVKAFVK